MALKDAIDKIVSYFDTDEVTDYEDAAKEEAKERPVKARPVKVQRPVQTPPPRQQRQPERSQATVPPRRQHVNSDLQETQDVYKRQELSWETLNHELEQLVEHAETYKEAMAKSDEITSPDDFYNLLAVSYTHLSYLTAEMILRREHCIEMEKENE